MTLVRWGNRVCSRVLKGEWQVWLCHMNKSQETRPFVERDWRSEFGNIPAENGLFRWNFSPDHGSPLQMALECFAQHMKRKIYVRTDYFVPKAIIVLFLKQKIRFHNRNHTIPNRTNAKFLQPSNKIWIFSRLCGVYVSRSLSHFE